jgi:ParB family chromosome partitioning protein
MNSKKRALGKGLGALLGGTGYEESLESQLGAVAQGVGTIARIPISSIERNPFQPRQAFEQESLNNLAASIKEQGIIQPVTVTPHENEGKFTLISGERRCKAAQMAGLTHIPAYLIDASDDNKKLELAIIENIQREDLNPIEIALGFKQLLERYELTQEMVAERVGKSRSSVANYIRLLNLPGEIQIGLKLQLISMGHARALITVDDINTKIDIYNDIIHQGLSVRDVEEIVKNLLETQTNESEEDTKKSEKPIVDKEKFNILEKQLSDLLGSKVKFKSRGGGKGTLSINFSSDQDLERILTLIKNENRF